MYVLHALPQAFAARTRKRGLSLCGIAGFTHRNECPDPELIRKATATLGHRGPDQMGVFGSSSVSLGAARLKIIDLETGDQPLTTADGDATIVFNGEITTTSSCAPSWNNAATSSARIATPKSHSARSSNGTRTFIPIVLAAISLVGIMALLASGFSANARDSTPVCAWRRAWDYSLLLPRQIWNGTQTTWTSLRTLQHTRS
jgi:hypothetical protein